MNISQVTTEVPGKKTPLIQHFTVEKHVSVVGKEHMFIFKTFYLDLLYNYKAELIVYISALSYCF